MTRVFVLANLWDLVDFGAGECLDHIQALGVDGVTVIATSGPIAQMRARSSASSRVFRSRGGFFFRPSDDCYRDTRLKPIVSTWCKGRNPLETIAEGCRHRKLALRIRTSAFEVGRIASRHPESAGQTVFGNRSPLTLCPGDPHVRALLRATVADLAAYEPATVEITHTKYHAGALAGEGLKFGCRPNGDFVALLEICFAEPSRQIAVESSLDVEAAASCVRTALESAIRTGNRADISDASLGEGAEALRTYLSCQRATLRSLFAGITDATTAETAFVVENGESAGNSSSCSFAPAAELDADAASVVQVFDSENIGDTVTAMVARFGKQAAIELSVGEMLCEEPQLLVRTCQQVAEQGVPTIVLGNYSLWPQSGDEVVRQAVRFASRASG